MPMRAPGPAHDRPPARAAATARARLTRAVTAVARRPRGNRKLSGRILAGQLAILGLTSAIGFVLFAVAQRGQLDREYERQALAIATTTAAEPQIRQAIAYGTGGDVVQAVTQRIAASTGASYVVVIDRHGIRHSHPHPELVGVRVDAPGTRLDGRSHVGVDNGSTGRSANGRAPLYGPAGDLVGQVSAGIRERTVVDQLWQELPVFGLFAGVALAVGAGASVLLARRLKRSTFGLELEEITELLQDREAMLHGIREGVLAFDRRERITVVNDEARRLLGLGTALGRTLAEVLPDGRLRRALDGTLAGHDITVLTDSHCLAVNRMPVVLHGRELGAVVTVRDRTELVGLLRELDSVRGLTDALRSQQHEFSNRMHTLAGLLELGEHEAALEFAVESAGAEPSLAGSVRDRIGNPLMAGLVMAKTTVAQERGVRLALDAASELGEAPPHLDRLLTIVGNLVDNAVDAAADGPPPAGGPRQVTLRLTEDAAAVRVRVADTGPGVPGWARSRIFEDGWSTRPGRGTARRGLGLALVHRLVRRHGGTIEVSEGRGAVFTVVLPVPDPADDRRAALTAKGADR
ncbi:MULTISPECIES: sensor histidine kinase [Streptomycetaceae]|uniref:histidine kinase n=1 Tax=Streptantibioticus cattleyicolor (strain ATCC 35852 / DSM 46488 / JCM 4925 / NBRC 14057 / NRRL 8057) TaxID=1003195 RepID=F8JVQ8_STREN|nr:MULTISPECIES: sensor histidine kinase [Streptomycetaceae]AEW96970.1 signal transduction histidine kinase regulating citrate/malate metabolism [Streptantibioticus cattleyicolor NRRL 8057 = DSM 46488]MYS61439.1 PAS domain-containing protein [Streptomyces sp. SID5468]CCB77295.1 Signal transduction histidine kinase regulating citrate/malate metabolism [Streptantibioticus cattleyicolor NRRL 8057 = DSM 46488]